MAKNEAKIKFTAETGQFNQEIQKSNREMSEFKAELKLNETQMKATGATVEALEKKHSILENQLKASENKTEALNQKVKKAVEIFGEDSAEVSKLRTQLTNAQNEQAKLEKAVRECSDALEEQEKSTKTVNEGFAQMGETMSDLAKGGVVATVGALGAVGAVAGKTANDIDKATNTFIAQTGESTKNAEQFEDAMVNIYNGNYGESFEDISSSMATVKTAMGDIGTDELEKLTTDALVLRDTFDMDVNESIRAVNSLMDQFGITGDEAYSLIAQGAQNGLNQNGDLLDVVNEYSVQFKNAGYNANDMFNMLANGTEAGTWSVDKLGDAVKEFNIRASDGTVSDAIKENAKAFGLSKTEAKNLASEVESGSVGAYQKLAETLRGVDDDTQRYQLGVSMFGTMWEDLGEEAVLAMLDTKGEISTTKNALDEINEVKYDNLGSAFEGIKRNLETSVAEPIKTNVMPAVNEFVEDVDWQGVGNTIGETFGVVVEGAVAVVGAVKESVQWMKEHQGVVIAVATVVGVLTAAITAYNIVQGIKTAMDAANVTTVWALVSAHIAQAAAAIAAIAPYVLIGAAIAAVIAIIVLCIKYWDEIVAAVKNCIAKISEAWKSFTNWLSTNVIKPLLEWFKNLWSGIKNVFAKVGSWFSEKFQSAKNGALNAWSSVKSWFSNLWSGIKNVFSNIGSWFSEKFQSAKNGAINAWNSVRSWFSNLWNGIKGVFSSIGSWFSEKFQSAKNGVFNAWSNVTSKFSNIKNSIVNAFSNVKEKLSQPFEKARDAIKSVADKIKGFFSGMKISLPNIKLPHFKVTGKLSISPPSVPKLSIEWYKDGGIMVNPTIFGVNGNRLMAGGEAGPEAILPISKLEDYISGAIERTMNVVNLEPLANAIEDLANRPISMNINGRQFAYATASDTDSVGGMRSTFRSRGLAVE